jgi:hypothetical protein
VHAYGSIPICTDSCEIKCYIAMVGDANPAVLGRTLRFTTKSSEAIPAMIRRRI